MQISSRFVIQFRWILAQGIEFAEWVQLWEYYVLAANQRSMATQLSILETSHRISSWASRINEVDLKNQRTNGLT